MDFASVRKTKNLTQLNLANRLGVTRQLISAIETGQARPSVDTAKALSAVLEIDWVAFFDDTTIVSEMEVPGNDESEQAVLQNLSGAVGADAGASDSPTGDSGNGDALPV